MLEVITLSQREMMHGHQAKEQRNGREQAQESGALSPLHIPIVRLLRSA